MTLSEKAAIKRLERKRAWCLFAVLLAVSACLLLVLTPAKASEMWLTVGGLSYHADRSQNYNERNLGLGLEYRQDKDHAVGFGTYRNSHRRDSFMAAHAWTPLGGDTVRLGVAWGLVSGYAPGLVPFVLPVVTLDGGRFGATIAAWPSMGGNSGGAAIQFRMRFL